MTRTILILMTLGMSFSLSAATAQKSGGALSATDKKFMMEAAQGGMAEVKLGQLALKQASNTDVKSFGQHMVEDHSKANDELKALAQQKNVTLPKDVKPADQALYNRLSKLNGATFDKQYMSEMVKDHQKDVSEFKHASTACKDADVKALAQQKNVTLPKDVKPADQALYNRLSKLNGAAFDKQYMSEMVKDHQKDVSEFKQASTACKDADVKAWAGKTLPVLEDHLKMAQQRSAEVSKGGGKK